MGLAANISLYPMLIEATILVKIVLGVLVLMSLISWGLIFYKLILLNKTKRDVIQEHREFLKAKGLVSALRELKRKSNSCLYNIGSKAIGEIRALENAYLEDQHKNTIASENIQRVLRQAVSIEVNRLSYALSFLATCANSAPFIGLFGTVWGIMNSFQSIGMQKSAALSTVAPGIAEALIATAFGLAVAIPASIAYNSFLSVVATIETELDSYAGDFLNRAKREMSWFGSSRTSGKTPGDNPNSVGQTV